MKQFSLKEYLKDPSRKVVTRDGKPVRIICTDAVRKTHPIVALVKSGDEDLVQCYMSNGKLYKNAESTVDLFFAPVKCEGWVNIYKSTNAVVNKRTGYVIFDTKEEALEVVKSKAQAMYQDEYLDTIHIEWEEE